jgi:hypothetical protein
MYPRPRPRALVPFLVLLMLCLSGQVGSEDSAPRERIQTTMHAFFQVLTSVFPWSPRSRGLNVPAAFLG